MKYLSTPLTALLCGLLALTSCGKSVLPEDEALWGERTNELTILTRADDEGDDRSVAYPVWVYVFSGSTCVDVQEVQTASDALTFKLAKGRYDIYALGVTDDERYALPAADEATLTTLIKPKTGKVFDDLQTAHSTITLTNDESSQLTLGMERKVAMLKSVTIKKVPDEVTAVSVSVAPLHEAILLNGELDDSSEGSLTVALTKQTGSEGTWAAAETAFMLPAVGMPTITVRFTTAAGTKAYAYNSPEEMNANYKFNLDGTFTGGAIALSGTLTGAQWAGEKTISFSFEGDDDSGDDTSGDTGDNAGGAGDDSPTGVPTVGSLYNGCYVLAVTENAFTILSPRQETKIFEQGSNTNEPSALEALQARLESWTVDGVTATWRIPTLTEAKVMYNKRTDIDSKNSVKIVYNSYGYYVIDDTDNNKLRHYYKVGSTSNMTTGIGSYDCYLRPVATIATD